MLGCTCAACSIAIALAAALLRSRVTVSRMKRAEALSRFVTDLLIDDGTRLYRENKRLRGEE